MALRPPEPRRRPRVRRTGYSDLVRALIASALVTIIGLRILLAAIDIATWTITWRIIAAITAPVIWIAHIPAGFRTEIIGHLTAGEVVAGVVLWLVAAYLLATLTVRDRP
ncbi:MAG: hypothetical protein ACOC9Y_01490 [Chloroflexota bacterium]